jgi:hypothetical protein
MPLQLRPLNLDRDGQLANIAMSPAEHAKVGFQRTGSVKEGNENVLTRATGFLNIDVSHGWSMAKDRDIT